VSPAWPALIHSAVELHSGSNGTKRMLSPGGGRDRLRQ